MRYKKFDHVLIETRIFPKNEPHYIRYSSIFYCGDNTTAEKLFDALPSQIENKFHYLEKSLYKDSVALTYYARELVDKEKSIMLDLLKSLS